MRVAVDFRGGCEEGTSNRSYWQGLVRGLTETCPPGDEIVLLTNGPSALAESFAVPGKCRCAASKRMSDRYWSLVWMPSECRRLKVDVAHVQYTVSPLFKTPVVTTIHDVSFLVHPAWFSRRDAFLLGKSVPLAVKKARRVLAVSEFTKSELIRTTGCPASKIVVTPNAPQDGIHPHPALSQGRGSPEDPHLTSPKGEEPVHHPSSPDEDARGTGPYLLSVGTLQSRKNWRLVLEAFALYRALHPDVVLVMAGPCRIPRSDFDAVVSRLSLPAARNRNAGANQPAATRCAEPGDSVVLTGTTSVEELVGLYSAAAALLHPSFYEGFGMTALEALKCGCPVVASNSSSLPEVVQGYGVLVDGFDPADWAAGIVAATQLSADVLCRGMEYAAGFTWERTARQVWEVYRSLA